MRIAIAIFCFVVFMAIIPQPWRPPLLICFLLLLTGIVRKRVWGALIWIMIAIVFLLWYGSAHLPNAETAKQAPKSQSRCLVAPCYEPPSSEPEVDAGKARLDNVENIARQCEELASRQMAPYVLKFDSGYPSYHPHWDDHGKLIKETIGFTMLNGTMRYFAECTIDRQGLRVQITR